MNNPVKTTYEEWMTEDDIATYDSMVSMGRTQLGKELAKNEEFLLHISAMITLKQMKGMLVDVDEADIAKLKRIHKEHQEAGLIFETPSDEWYASAEALKKPYLPEEVQKEIEEQNALTSNVVISDKKSSSTSNIEDEAPDDDIKKGYVKLVVPEATPEL